MPSLGIFLSLTQYVFPLSDHVLGLTHHLHCEPSNSRFNYLISLLSFYDSFSFTLSYINLYIIINIFYYIHISFYSFICLCHDFLEERDYTLIHSTVFISQHRTGSHSLNKWKNEQLYIAWRPPYIIRDNKVQVLKSKGLLLTSKSPHENGQVQVIQEGFISINWMIENLIVVCLFGLVWFWFWFLMSCSFRGLKN